MTIINETNHNVIILEGDNVLAVLSPSKLPNLINGNYDVEKYDGKVLRIVKSANDTVITINEKGVFKTFSSIS